MRSLNFVIYSLLVIVFCFIEFNGLYAQSSINASKNSSVIWKTFNDVSIPVPPKFHPRLYLNPEHVAQLKARLAHPVLKGIAAGLKTDAGKSVQMKIWDNIFQFLWWDVNIQRVPVTTLPLSKYFPGPFGWMIARTSWDKNAVIAEMKLNEYNFVNHQHLDAGSFQIFYRSSLVTESGLYTGSSGRYASPHNLNYYKRTIAHNSLLIYDPQEIFPENHGNDGGQRFRMEEGKPIT